MLTLTCCQDHILTENIWFVWSKTSYTAYTGDERRCHYAGRTNGEQLKIELLSQWKLETEFRNFKLIIGGDDNDNCDALK